MVLLSPQNGARRPLRKWDSGATQPGWNLTFRPGDNIQNVCQNPRPPIYLSDLYPETICDSLRTNVFWVVLEAVTVLASQL